MTAARRTTAFVAALVVALVLAFAADRWASSSPDGFERVAVDNELVLDAAADDETSSRSTIATVARTTAAIVAVALTLLALPRIAARRRPDS
jgi:hypothetical protein